MRRIAHVLAVTLFVAFALLFVSSFRCAPQQQKDGASPKAAAQSKPIPISVKVEAEGGGKGQGMWTQAATDLTPKEMATLETLIVQEFKKQEGEDVKIVPLDYPENYIYMTVVAAKLPRGHAGKWYYIVSSVMMVSNTKNETDELVTHDVIVEYDLASVARAIAYQFAVMRFRAVSGLWK